jgi:hypothetical protein
VELLNHLASWVPKTNAENAFVSFALFLVTRWMAQADEKNSSSPRPALVEFGAFHLYPHFGNTTAREPAAVASVIALLEKLKHARSSEQIFAGKSHPDPNLAAIVSHVQFYLEDVRGSAYITQLRVQMEEIQGPFESWFRHHAGVGPKRAIGLLYAIQEQLMENFEEARKAAAATRDAEEAARSEGADSEAAKESAQCLAFIEGISRNLAPNFPVSREQLTRLVPPPTEEEWGALIQLIGLTGETRDAFIDPVEVKHRPLFVLPDQRVFLVDLSSAVEELFSAFDQVARTDQRFFSGKYHENQKEWMEGSIAEQFTRIFPRERVFVGLEYPNPDKPGDFAELDVAVEWGPFLLLVEAKGRQFRLFEALSDLGRLRTDLKSNVQDAFEQADRAARFVNGGPVAIFKERKTGRELKVAVKKLRRLFKISVTLHHLADFATQLANLKSLNLFSAQDYPYSVSLADLDIITRFSDGPDALLHYVQRRLELQRSEKPITADELDLFGTYLDTRLQPSFFWNRKPDEGKDFTHMWISGGSEKFDAWHDAQLGIRDVTPDIHLNLPPGVKDLLLELRNRDDDGARWISFALLNLTRKGADRLDRLLAHVRELNVECGKMQSTTFVDESLVAVVTVGRLVATGELRRTLFARVSVEKYRRKVASAFGFAIELNDAFKPFDSALWAEGEWEHDSEMDHVMRAMPPMRVRPGQRIPQPNDPCVCGSEKKFKKCCMPFFEKK